jgi:DNA invertase Pin-like site-specific DNA recombinase
MPAAVYIPVSSPKGQKTDSQRTELEAWLKRQRLKAVQCFEDRESATTVVAQQLVRHRTGALTFLSPFSPVRSPKQVRPLVQMVHPRSISPRDLSFLLL